MGKVVYNACYGGFGLSSEAMDLYNKLSGRNVDSHHEIERDDPYLVEVVETLGENSWDRFSHLRIKYVPAGELWRIDEYDGYEAVMTQNDYEWKISK